MELQLESDRWAGTRAAGLFAQLHFPHLGPLLQNKENGIHFTRLNERNTDKRI